LCFSPDFTHADAAERDRQVQRQRTAIDLYVSLGIRHRRPLSGQRYPGLTRKDGIERTVAGPLPPCRSCRRADEIVFRENNWQGTAAWYLSLRYALERGREGHRPSGCRQFEDVIPWSLSERRLGREKWAGWACRRLLVAGPEGAGQASKARVAFTMGRREGARR
jgi:hypothetical protein